MLVKFNKKPFGAFNDEFFNDFAGFFKNEAADWKSSAPVNIHEKDKSYEVEVIAPGFDKTDFKINLEKDILTISASRKEEQKDENKKEVRREYAYRSFKRSFTVDEKIDVASIEAAYVNGVLTVNLPKKEIVKEEAKEIAIK